MDGLAVAGEIGGRVMIDVALYTAAGYRYETPARARNVRLSHTRKGPGALGAYFPMSLEDAFKLYSHAGLLYAVAVEEGAVIWRGRVEDVKISNRGAEIQAFGLLSAFSDTLYTALWSRTSTADWREVTQDDSANAQPQLYELDNNNRLYIAPRAGEAYTNNSDTGGWTFAIPHLSARDIAEVEFTYSATLPTDWKLELVTATHAFGSGFTDWSLTGNGSNQTATVTETLTTASKRIIFRIYNSTGGTYTATGSTGDWFAKLTSIRVKTTTAATVLASDIASALYSAIDTANSGQLAGSLVTASTVDLQDEVYEDMRPAAILDDLAFRSGAAWGVDVNGIFYWQERSEVVNRYFVDALDIALERSLSGIYNKVYGIYNDANGWALRTAAAEDTVSQSAYGLTREESIQADTTSATQAEAHRDALLADSAFYIVRASIIFETIYDATGQRVSGAGIQGNDTVTIRNLPPQLATDLDELATFTIDTAEFDAETGKLQLQPALPIPTLVTLIAQG